MGQWLNVENEIKLTNTSLFIHSNKSRFQHSQFPNQNSLAMESVIPCKYLINIISFKYNVRFNIYKLLLKFNIFYSKLYDEFNLFKDFIINFIFIELLNLINLTSA